MPRPAEALDQDRLVKALYEILRTGNAMALHFERLARDLKIEEGASTIVFLSGIKKILRDLPDKAFAEPKQRLALVDAIQDALDTAVEAEEAALDEQGLDETQEEEPADARAPLQGKAQIKPLTGGSH